MGRELFSKAPVPQLLGPASASQMLRKSQGVALQHILYSVKVKVNSQLEIFSIVNSQATVSLGCIRSSWSRSSEISAIKPTIVILLHCHDKIFSVKILT